MKRVAPFKTMPYKPNPSLSIPFICIRKKVGVHMFQPIPLMYLAGFGLFEAHALAVLSLCRHGGFQCKQAKHHQWDVCLRQTTSRGCWACSQWIIALVLKLGNTFFQERDQKSTSLSESWISFPVPENIGFKKREEILQHALLLQNQQLLTERRGVALWST